MSHDGERTHWRGHSAFRIEAGEAKILIDPLLSDNPSRDKGWSWYLTGEKLDTER
jgi:L-ascorbate metabolism protein UlaG (beta-lactamase superfamily)